MIMSKLPIMVFVAAILVASFMMLTVPAANALTTRDYTYLNDNPITARTGNSAVCGDHICAPGEWDKLTTSLNNAQRGQQAGWTAAHSATTTSNATAPTYPPTPSTSSTGVSTAACNSILSLLNNAGVSDKVTTQVMTDLGCSYK